MTHEEQMAYPAGQATAEELNDTPAEAQNWSPLGVHDDMPDGDYHYLRGLFGEVTADMNSAYRRGFNETFVPVRGDDD